MKGVDPKTLQANLVCLTGENYEEWAHKFIGLFSFLSLSSHIELDLNAFDDATWVETEQDIKNTMASFAEPRFHSLIQNSKTVAVAWDKLKAICEQNKTPFELFVLLDSFKFTESTSFNEIKQSVQEAEFLCDNLAMNQNADQSLGGEFHKKARLVSSLPSAFTSIQQQLIDDLPSLDYETVKSRVLDYGKELSRQQINAPSIPNSVPISSASPPSSSSNVPLTRTPAEKPDNEMRSPAGEQPAATQQSAATQPSVADQQSATGQQTAAAPTTASDQEKDGDVTPSHKVLIVDTKSAANPVPGIQDIRYMSPADYEKSLKRETCSATPPHRRRSESIEGPAKSSKRSESPRDRKREKRNRSRDDRSKRDRSRNRERKDSRRGRNDSLGNNAFTQGALAASINQNKVNRGLTFPAFTDITMFKNLQSFGSISDCNRALLSECSKIPARKELSIN